MASSKEDDKVFDVAHPGKTAASASSRPLIIGHKSILKDPMVKESSVSEISDDKEPKSAKTPEDDIPSGNPMVEGEAMPEEPAEELTDSPSSARKSIKPLSSKKKKEKEESKEAATKVTKASKVKIITDDDETSDEELPAIVAANADDQAKVDKPAAEEEPDDEAEDTSEEETADEPEEEPSEDEPATEDTQEPDESGNDKADSDKSSGKTKDKSSDSDSTSSDNKTDSTATEEQKKQTQADQAALARNEELEKEISAGEYFVPIGEKTRKKRSLRHILVGTILILLLGIALADLMIDVGIIKTDIKPPISVFNSN